MRCAPWRRAPCSGLRDRCWRPRPRPSAISTVPSLRAACRAQAGRRTQRRWLPRRRPPSQSRRPTSDCWRAGGSAPRVEDARSGRGRLDPRLRARGIEGEGHRRGAPRGRASPTGEEPAVMLDRRGEPERAVGLVVRRPHAEVSRRHRCPHLEPRQNMIDAGTQLLLCSPRSSCMATSPPSTRAPPRQLPLPPRPAGQQGTLHRFTGSTRVQPPPSFFRFRRTDGNVHGPWKQIASGAR